MNLRKTSAFALYIGSYLPLSAILLAQDIDTKKTSGGACTASQLIHYHCIFPLQHPIISISCVVTCAFCLIVTFLTLKIIPTKNRIKIIESKHIPADLINYVIPYILSFISLDYSSTPKLIGFFLFFVWIFWITYRSGQIAMNPVLSGFGWKLFEIKYHHLGSQDTFIGRIISTVDIAPNETYRQANLQDVMVVKNDPKESKR